MCEIQFFSSCITSHQHWYKSCTMAIDVEENSAFEVNRCDWCRPSNHDLQEWSKYLNRDHHYLREFEYTCERLTNRPLQMYLISVVFLDGYMPLTIVLTAMIYLKYSVISKWLKTKQDLATGRIHTGHTVRVLPLGYKPTTRTPTPHPPLHLKTIPQNPPPSS